MAENSKSSLENLFDNNLAGLIIPEKAPATSSISWLMLAIMLIVIAYMMWKWLQFHKQTKQKALREITSLQRNISQYKPQIAANKLASILRGGLNVTRLSLFSAADQEQWHLFKKKLDTACYSTESLSESELAKLIKQAQTWLKQS